jgi:hypothetical protein
MFRLRAGVIATLAVLALHAGPAAADPPTTFNPVVEAQNFSITQQRQAVYDTPQYQDYGLVRPVLFTARNGATISGHVWATVAGPARRQGS